LSIRERYEAQKEARERSNQERGPQPWWWLGQRDPIVRLTKWLVIWTALLFVGTVVSAGILWKTDGTLRAGQRAFVFVKFSDSHWTKGRPSGNDMVRSFYIEWENNGNS
jgi:hypothetical protein